MSLNAYYVRFIGWRAEDMDRDRAADLTEFVPEEFQYGDVSCTCFHNDSLDYIGFGMEVQSVDLSDGVKPVDYREDWRLSDEEIMKILTDLPLSPEEKEKIGTYQFVVLGG